MSILHKVLVKKKYWSPWYHVNTFILQGALVVFYLGIASELMKESHASFKNE